MIIKNNFNKNSIVPLNDYHEIGKGSKSLDRQFEMKKEGFIPENMNNSVLQDIDRDDNEFNDDKNEDKWSFFR